MQAVYKFHSRFLQITPRNDLRRAHLPFLYRLAGIRLQRWCFASLHDHRPGSFRTTLCRPCPWPALLGEKPLQAYRISLGCTCTCTGMSSSTESHLDVGSSDDDKLSGQKENGQDGRRNEGDYSSSSSMPTLVNEETVAMDKLTSEEREIYRLHQEACKAGQSSYTDPSTGYVVFTQHYHITRGKCCGSCCRHCPYGHVNVLEKYRTKTFNTAFYV